jgi:hypothetical protein
MTDQLSTQDREYRPKIVSLEWGLFLRWLETNWEPGEHFALIGPTGEGKTTFAVGILQLRKWIMALDAKGEDDTLAASGFERITKFPLPRKVRDAVAEGKPARLIVGGPTTSFVEEKRLRALLAQAVAMVRHQGGWTLYADEFQILSDLRMFGLGKPIEQGLVSARSKGTSIVTSFQAPAWVPKASTRQATLVAMWPTRDRAMIKSVAESMGRDWREVEAIVDELPKYHVLVIPKSVFDPYILTHPPKVN